MATPISELGEFGLIEYLTQNVKHYHKSTIKGIGDDASVHSIGGNKVEVITNDLLLEGIHFDLTYMPLKHLGYKAVVVNVSDIYAMNATPKRMVLGLGISKKFSVEALNEFYEGILLACKRYNIDFVGGDTSASLTGLTISITVLGDGNADEISYRSGAKEKNLICVSGDLGGAYLGVQILEREKRILKEVGNEKPQLEDHKYAIGRQLKPEARQDIITFFKEKNIVPTAMIDISDGLSSELIHICKQSNVGCRIYEEKIPIALETEQTATKLNLNPLTAAINGGEDYELLFTVDIADYEKIAENPNITIIGHIEDHTTGQFLISKQEEAIPLKAMGWNQLKKDDEGFNDKSSS